MRDLLCRPEQTTSWLVEGLFHSGGSSLLVAKAKKGKSSLVRQLTIAVAQGIPFLGRPTKQGSVLYLALEDAENELANRFRLLGARPDDPISLQTSLAGKSKTSFVQYVRDTRPALVIVDTLMSYGGLRRWNDFGMAHEAIRPLHQMARETGAHVVLVHHAKKSGSDDVLDEVIGSSAFGASVDSIFFIKEARGIRTLVSGGQRYGAKFDDTVLAFDDQTGLFSVSGTKQDLALAKQKSDHEVLSQAMLDFVLSSEGCTKEAIFNGVKGSGRSKSDALRDLREANLLRIEGLGRAG